LEKKANIHNRIAVMWNFIFSFALASFSIPSSIAADFNIDWIKNGDGYEDRNAQVGDTVEFKWSGFHNVYIHLSGTCATTIDTRILVGKAPDTSGIYTFTKADSGKSIFFACDVGSHCSSGRMGITFTVDESEENPLCKDNNEWKFKGKNKRNCGWVHKGNSNKLCKKKNKKKPKAKEDCPIACGNDKDCTIPKCLKDDEWSPNNENFVDCSAIEPMSEKNKKKILCNAWN